MSFITTNSEGENIPVKETLVEAVNIINFITSPTLSMRTGLFKGQGRPVDLNVGERGCFLEMVLDSTLQLTS